MNPFSERVAQLKHMLKAATAIGLAVLDISSERQAEIMSVILPVLPSSRSRDQLLLVAYDRGIAIELSHRDEQERLVAERERRKAKLEASRADRARKKAAAEADQALFEAWKRSTAS